MGDDSWGGSPRILESSLILEWSSHLNTRFLGCLTVFRGHLMASAPPPKRCQPSQRSSGVRQRRLEQSRTEPALYVTEIDFTVRELEQGKSRRSDPGEPVAKEREIVRAEISIPETTIGLSIRAPGESPWCFLARGQSPVPSSQPHPGVQLCPLFPKSGSRSCVTGPPGGSGTLAPAPLGSHMGHPVTPAKGSTLGVSRPHSPLRGPSSFPLRVSLPPEPDIQNHC